MFFCDELSTGSVCAVFVIELRSAIAQPPRLGGHEPRYYSRVVHRCNLFGNRNLKTHAMVGLKFDLSNGQSAVSSISLRSSLYHLIDFREKILYVSAALQTAYLLFAMRGGERSTSCAWSWHVAVTNIDESRSRTISGRPAADAARRAKKS